MILLNLFWSFFKIGFLAFGGGYGALSLIQDQIVNINNWMNLEEFLTLISISQMTPGPIAINSATFIGYRIAGVPGSVCSTVGVVLPSVFWIFLILKLLKLLSRWIDTSEVFNALRLGIVALILSATFRIGIESINSVFTIVTAVSAFYILYKFKLSVIWIVFGTGILGVFWSFFLPL
ncbi:chromate transporter [Mesotoga sp. H07.pep.5.3]|jgi:chromate transporter|uniref:chromate transporter n=1 Tax=Mesotoga sp. H07.pep.5.3 TaxID=1421003 RepID=UPI000C185ACE|nr:chromate transporter [Mesotoga sp. H07.pep.5.3]PIJ60575.1 chromate transporter [Mesotoga sp. H07.pep.5.3]